MHFLGLNGIFKNEAKTIVKTLKSARPYVDFWCIVDTGSTDGTQDLILDTMHGIPGRLINEPFVDYSTSRNFALDQCLGGCTWALLLSGGETVEGHPWTGALESTRPPYAHYMRILFGTDLEYDQIRLVRPDSRWRYQGVTHEALCHPEGHTPGHVSGAIRSGTAEDKTARWTQDVELLFPKALEGDPRSIYYLAQSHACLGETHLALGWYRTRVLVGGKQDEVFWSWIRIGQMAKEPDALRAAMRVYPHRAEPWYELAKLHRARGDFERAMLCAEHAQTYPEPRDAGFVDVSVYRHRIRDEIATIQGCMCARSVLNT